MVWFMQCTHTHIIIFIEIAFCATTRVYCSTMDAEFLHCILDRPLEFAIADFVEQPASKQNAPSQKINEKI